MASRTQPAASTRPVPRLYLVLPPSAAPERLADDVSAALAAADIAAVLLPLMDADERALINGIRTLAPAIQERGAALILDGRADLVARAGADGAHLTGIDDFKESLAALRPERIAGCGGLATRHEAMLAAEAGADYVMFGEPDADGHRPAFDAIVERVGWWAEVFEIPCVGHAEGFDEIAPLVQAGADFVATGAFIFSDPRGPACAVETASACLRIPEAAG